MDERFALVGTCGLYCGACPHFLAEQPACQGCHGSPEAMHPWCAECGIRACAGEKGLLHCAECPEYPCEKTASFHCGERHHQDAAAGLARLKAVGPELWLDQERERWTCTCGTSFSWYQGLCYTCGETVPSYR
jgi:hypothetical protein